MYLHNIGRTVYLHQLRLLLLLQPHVRFQAEDHSWIFLLCQSLAAEFREPRVIELWEAAKRSNLSDDELDSLKVPIRLLNTTD